MEYGTLLGVDLNNNKSIQQILLSYYDNPIMTKLLVQNNEAHYYCKIKTKLLGENRYIIVITRDDKYPLQTKKFLKNLNWHSFQTRSISRNYNINSISMNYKNKIDNIYLKLKQKNDNYTSYKCSEIPNIDVHVLNIEGKIYPHEATLENALEEFRTLINII